VVAFSARGFAEEFTEWVNAALPVLQREHVAIDGKTLRGSHQPDGEAVHRS